MFGGAKVASLSFAGDCVLGASARIGSGGHNGKNRKFGQQNCDFKAGRKKKKRPTLLDSFFGVFWGTAPALGQIP
jgi:hypothetical protein